MESHTGLTSQAHVNTHATSTLFQNKDQHAPCFKTKTNNSPVFAGVLQGLLERMKTKLKKADLTGAAKFAPGAPGFDAPPSTGPSMGSGRPQMPPSPPSRRP
jgi:hypothetical protein